MKDWIPLIQQLIWPLFIVILLVAFRGKLEGLYKMATEGREIEIAGVLKIGQAVRETNINQFAKGDMSIDVLEEDEHVVEKGSMSMLQKLQEQLRNSELTSIDVMVIRSGKYYFKDLMLKYVSTLGIKQIIFIDRQGQFDGWIESSIFSGQLLAGERREYRYPDLKNFLAGIHYEEIAPTEKTIDVLEKMKESRLDYLPVVDSKKYRYFVNKADILTSLVSTAITQPQKEKVD